MTNGLKIPAVILNLISEHCFSLRKSSPKVIIAMDTVNLWAGKSTMMIIALGTSSKQHSKFSCLGFFLQF